MRQLLLLLLLIPSFANAAATDQPLLDATSTTYLGYFTLPSSFSDEVRGLGLSADGTQLYVGQLSDRIGLVTIPTLGVEATQNIAPTVISGQLPGASPEADEIAGIYVDGSRLIISKRYYWDTDAGTQKGAFQTLGLDLTSVSGFYEFADITYRPFVNGYIGLIPTEWQTLLGGEAFAGNSLMSLNSLTSNGPSFYAFDLGDVGVQSPIPNEELMVFPYAADNSTHMLNLDIDVPNEWLVAGDRNAAGIVFPSGSRSVLFFHGHGDTVCYGTAAECGNDTCQPYHGEHSQPTHRMIMAFDANDLLAVKNSTKLPHEVEPYAQWEIPGLPSGSCDNLQNSALAYDPSSGKVYIAADDYWSTRRIYVLQVTATQQTTYSTGSMPLIQ